MSSDRKLPRFGDDEDFAKMTQMRAPPGVRPRPARKPWLFVVSGSSAGRLVPVRDGMVLGRSTDADVVLDDEGVSRHHARIQIFNLVVRVVDLNSRNGIQIDGTTVKSHAFREGDRLRLGDANVMFAMLDDDDDLLRRNLFASATNLASRTTPPK